MLTNTTTTTTVPSPTTTRLLTSLLNIASFTPKLESVLLRSGYFEPDTGTIAIPYLLLEGARLANQLVEDLVAFDIEARTQMNVPRFPIFRAGVDARTFVELYEAFNRDCIDGVEASKEGISRQRDFLGFWHGLERSARRLVGYLVQ